jgi:hypothetical protein
VERPEQRILGELQKTPRNDYLHNGKKELEANMAKAVEENC